MAKSRALVPISSRGLSTRPQRTIEAKVEVVPKNRDLALRTKNDLATRDSGQLTVPKDRGQTVIVRDPNSQTGSGAIGRANGATGADGGLKGLVKASDAVAAGANVDLLRPLILSMGNKRKRQALADGGSIQRRVGGTGFGGANNRGFLSRGKKVGGPSYGGNTADPYDYVTKKRSNVGDGPDVSTTGKKPDTKGGKPLALEDSKGGKPLALEDSKRGQPLALTNGEGKNQLALVPEKGGALATVPENKGKLAKVFEKEKAPKVNTEGSALSTAEQTPVFGQLVDAARYLGRQASKVADTISEENVRADDAQVSADYKGAKKLKYSSVIGRLKGGDFKGAMNDVFSSPKRWETQDQQDRAAAALEKYVKSLGTIRRTK